MIIYAHLIFCLYKVKISVILLMKKLPLFGSFLCEYKYEALTLTERSWQCPICRQTYDRYINAAKNIEKIG